MTKKILFMAAAVVLLSSCAKVASTEIKSGGIYATYSVTGNSAGGASCTAVFQVGSETGTYVSLEGTDKVTCDGRNMAKSEFLGMITYTTSVPYDLNKTYTMKFTRDGEPDYKSDMSLPEPVAITWPAAGERVNSAPGVELRWALGASTAYDVQVNLYGPKSSTVFASTYPDIGTKLMPADSFEMPVGSTAENFTATVTRSRAGSFPSGLAGGYAWGRQQKSVTFTVSK